MNEIPNIKKRLPKKAVFSTSYIIGPHPDGYVLRDSHGIEVSPVLSTAAILSRWAVHNGYKRRVGKTLVFYKR